MTLPIISNIDTGIADGTWPMPEGLESAIRHAPSAMRESILYKIYQIINIILIQLMI